MIEKGEIALKGELIKLAITIISDGLRSSLNMEAGGEIAANLDSLYEYMSQRLLKAHIDNDTEVLDEVVGLLNDIKAGWDGIKGQV